jgi:hydroxyacylglutathione hydrolase
MGNDHETGTHRSSMHPELVTLPVASDNYTYCCVHGSEAIAVDVARAEPVIALLEARNCTLRAILSTHHHGDHTAGNITLKKKTRTTIYGGDRRISGIDRTVSDTQVLTLGPFTFTCIAVPGHTRGCMAYHLQESDLLFTGDTLFYAGCGRIFEGSAAQLYASLSRIAALDGATRICCGHEYTRDNLLFARTIEPGNDLIVQRMAAVENDLRTKGYHGPVPLSVEQATNPFLRTGEIGIKKTLGMTDAPNDAVFAELRRRKDRF